MSDDLDDLREGLLEELARRTPEDEAAEQARIDREAAEYDAQCAQMISWLASLPAETVIDWNSHHVSPARPFALGWVDVRVPMLEAEAGWNWAWTIERSWFERSADGDLFSLPAEFDCLLELHPDGREPEYDDWNNFGPALDQVRLRCPNGRLHRYQFSDDEPIYWLSMRSSAVEVEIGGEQWLAAPAISPAAVSRALAGWVREQTGRTDISFRWEPSIPEHDQVLVAYARVAEWREQHGSAEPSERDEPPVNVCAFTAEDCPVDEVVRLVAATSPEILRREQEVEADIARRVAEFDQEAERRRREYGAGKGLHGTRRTDL